MSKDNYIDSLFDSYSSDDTEEDSNDLFQALADYEEQELSLPKYSELCKTESVAARLKDSIVITFYEFTRDTEKALLFVLVNADGSCFNVWFPKRCCSNLDLINKTVCVWDKIVNSNLDKEDLAELAVTPLYYDSWLIEKEKEEASKEQDRTGQEEASKEGT